MRILIETVPHAEQRYDTVGDWIIEPDGTWHIRISELPTCRDPLAEKFALLVAFHELIEMALCIDHQVGAEEVDVFDLHYPEGDTEPGDDRNAPYYHEHQLATGLERTLAAALDVDWQEYEEAINNLC